jgi:hypothetical protein
VEIIMTRTTQAFLIAAMAVSLWPLGLVVMISGDGDQTSVSRPAPAIRGDSKTSAARSELEEIVSNVHELNEDLADEELTRGEPRYDLTFRAQSIEEELVRWREESRGEATRREQRVARLLTKLMRAVVDLTEFPAQSTLRPYNRALRRFNTAAKRG